ncbi:acyl-CoA thioesterase [Rhodovulum sp. DZ06]|uniref:acyl-CoA thioesterase n=1 Tax=Rhodovulum sp. DZ06 TaxID=3425126 RepID=UPI003D344D81
MTRFSIRRQVEFNHCDPAGLVFYPRYYEMISALVERFFAEGLGHDWCEMGDAGLCTPMGKIETRFTAPSRLGDWLTLSLAVSRLGRASVGFDLMCETAGGPRFTGSATSICADMKAGRAQPWPGPIRAAFTPWLPIPGDASSPAAAPDMQKAAFR